MTLSLDDATEQVTATLDRHRERLLALSHALHEDPELAYDEHRSAARVAKPCWPTTASPPGSGCTAWTPRSKRWPAMAT